MSRFIKLPGFFFEDELLYFHEVWLNPVQVEGFISIDITYDDEDGLPVDISATKVFTKSGMEYDIKLSIEDFEKIVA